MAKKIELYSCGNGHEYLLWKECPFCCALYQVEPAETDEEFQKIYLYLKGKDAKCIGDFYKRYVPDSEPEISLFHFVFQ